MNEITNHAELTVEKKVEGTYKRDRNLMKLAYIAALIIVMAILEFNFFAILLIPLYPFLLTKLIIPATWYIVDIEEKMDISGGTLTLMHVYGKRKHKELCKVRVSAFDAIAPYRDEYKVAADKFAETADKRIECVSSMSHPDVYCAYGTNDFDEKIVVYFEVTEKALKVMKFLNKNTVIVPVSR